MSYLRRLARESQARFEPKRTRGLTSENTLRVEESFVEAPKPEPAAPRAASHRAAHFDQVIAPVPRPQLPARAETEAEPRIAHPVAPKETDQAAHAAQPKEMEIRRELPDAIEDMVVFEPQQVPRAHQPLQQEPREPVEMRMREAPDPRQAESVMARIRALTRQRTSPQQPGMEAVPRTADTQREPVIAEPKIDKVMPTPATESTRREAKHKVYLADDVESEVQPMTSRAARAINSSRSTQPRSEPQRTPQGDTVQVSFGSVVVHVEPEALPAPVVAKNVPTRAASNLNADADNRWARSFLDRV